MFYVVIYHHRHVIGHRGPEGCGPRCGRRPLFFCIEGGNPKHGCYVTEITKRDWCDVTERVSALVDQEAPMKKCMQKLPKFTLWFMLYGNSQRRNQVGLNL